jgi:hypothetical protein
MRLLIVLLCTLSASAQWQPRVIWDRSGLTDSAAYGTQILPLGDQNDDGFADWAVYARGNVDHDGPRASYIEFFRGGDPVPPEPYLVFRQDSLLYDQLWFVDSPGDLSGDGYADWLSLYWPRGFPPYRVYGFFWGGQDTSSNPDFSWTVPLVFGFVDLPGFDFNGDGIADLFGINNETGTARIYFGGTPLDTLPDWTLYQPPAGIDQTYPVAHGDFNGDGASDFICYNPNSPYHTALFLGGADPDTVPAQTWDDPYGPIGGVGSLNGDSLDELITGGGFVHFGRPLLYTMPDCTLHFSQFACPAGPQRAISAGDINHDGYNDLVMISSYCADNWFGALTVHLGHPWIYPYPTLEIDGWTDPLNLIGVYTAAGLGDVNGDGVDDIAIGAYHDTAYLGWRGRCIIIAGNDSLVASVPDWRPPTAAQFTLRAYPNPFNSVTTIEVELPTGSSKVQLTTFNVIGQRVAEVEVQANPGHFRYTYDASRLSSGLYLLRAKAGDSQSTIKLMLLK